MAKINYVLALFWQSNFVQIDSQNYILSHVGEFNKTQTRLYPYKSISLSFWRIDKSFCPDKSPCYDRMTCSNRRSCASDNNRTFHFIRLLLLQVILPDNSARSPAESRSDRSLLHGPNEFGTNLFHRIGW